jgi:hypothetical protein
MSEEKKERGADKGLGVRLSEGIAHLIRERPEDGQGQR